MKRLLSTVAACAMLAGRATAQTAAEPPVSATQSGAAPAAVAFDQIDIVSMGAYASSPGDFEKEATALEALAARRAANPAAAPAFTVPSKTLTRRAYWHGWTRIENVLAQTLVIIKPGEIDTVNVRDKTYRRQLTAAPVPGAASGFPFPFPPTGQASAVPGTIDISLGLDASSGAPMTIAGAAARGYTFSLDIDAGAATGSCLPFAQFSGIKATIENDVLERPEPAPAAPAATPFFTPETIAALPFFNPAACALHALTLRLTNLPGIVAFSEFYLYRRIEVKPAAGKRVPFLPTIVSERGNVRDLGDADAALFEIPPGYTQVP